MRSAQRLCLYALFAAFLCVISPLSLPMGPIPFSLSLLGVLLCAACLGPIGALTSVLLYLGVGAIGMPVFAGGMGGFGVLVGPTGGFLWSYPLIAILGGLLYRRVLQRERAGGLRQTVLCTLAGLPCVLVGYLAGTLQYAYVANVSFWSAAAITVLPFAAFDLLKLILVAVLARKIGRMHLIFT